MARLRPGRGSILLVVTALVVAAVAWLGWQRLPERQNAEGALPALELADLNGAPVALAGAGQPTLINLWATWCPPCRKEMPILAEAQAATPEVRFLFVNQGESPAVIREYLNEQQLDLNNVLLDPDMALSSRLNAPGLPTTLFYDAQGHLVARHLGELSEPQLAEYLQQLTDS